MLPPQPPAVAVSPAAAQQPAAPAASTARVFASDSGIIFNAIKLDKIEDFEIVLGRLQQALAASTDPTRRSQAAGWKVFRAAEPGPGGSVLYVFIMNPAVKGADYGVARILAEAFPEEAQDLYKAYTGAFATGQTILNLQPVSPPLPGAQDRTRATPAAPTPAAPTPAAPTPVAPTPATPTPAAPTPAAP